MEERREGVRQEKRALTQSVGEAIQLVPLPLFHIFFCQVLWTASLSRNTVLTKSPSYSRTGAASIGAWLGRRKTISWLIHPSPKQLRGGGENKNLSTLVKQ